MSAVTAEPRRFGTLFWSGRGTIGRPRTGSRSEITARHAFAAGACHQSGEDADVDVGPQKLHVAVREDNVGAALVEAINLSVIGAINGTRPGEFGPVRRR